MATREGASGDAEGGEAARSKVASRDDELPAAVKADAKLMAVWNAARRLKIEKIDQEEEARLADPLVRGAGNPRARRHVHLPARRRRGRPLDREGRRRRRRGGEGEGKGPTPPPDAVDSSDEEAAPPAVAPGGSGRRRWRRRGGDAQGGDEEAGGRRLELGNGAIRSFVVLREVLTARAGPPPSWQPPAVRSWIEVTAEDTAQLAAMWRQGDAAVKPVAPRRGARGRARRQVRVCVTTHGVPDEDFVEWYAREEENVEWRRTTRKGK